jgi:hypothetical protein
VRVHATSGEPPGLKKTLPDVLVVSLDRLPSHGRRVARWFWETKARRAVPIVFVGGDAAKLAAIRAEFEGAVFTSSRGLAKAIDRATGTPKAAAPLPTAGYSATPLPKKLGIVDGSRVAWLGGPAELRDAIAAAAIAAAEPAAKIGTSLGRVANDVVVLFVRTRAELERKLATAIDKLAPRGGLWIAWPKRSSGVATDIVEDTLREVVLPMGLVDNKVCAVDETWSGLRFVRRVAKARVAAIVTRTSR